MKGIRLGTLAFILLTGSLLVAYDVRPLKPGPAAEYPSHQDFQNITIGVKPYLTEEEVSTLFDSDRLIGREIMPLLVVVENRNKFAVALQERDIFLLQPDGTQVPTIPLVEVILRISTKRPLSSVGTRPDILIQQVGDRRLVEDFQDKALGEKQIAPGGTAFGIVFFPLPILKNLSGYRLYLPEIWNMIENEQLMFFEFELDGPSS